MTFNNSVFTWGSSSLIPVRLPQNIIDEFTLGDHAKAKEGGVHVAWANCKVKLDKEQRDLVAYHEDFLQEVEDGTAKKWMKGQKTADMVSDLLGVIDELCE